MESNKKKNEILKAASECFTRYGYDKTTLDDIGKLVGLNKASLYYYYRNKESIYSEVIQLEADRFIDSIKSQLSKKNGSREKVIHYLTERFRYFSHTIALHRLSEEVTVKFQEMFTGLIRMFRVKETAVIDEILKKAIETGEIRKCDTERVAENLINVAEGIKISMIKRDGTCNLKEGPDIPAIAKEIRFTAGLIMDGLVTYDKIKEK